MLVKSQDDSKRIQIALQHLQYASQFLQHMTEDQELGDVSVMLDMLITKLESCQPEDGV